MIILAQYSTLPLVHAVGWTLLHFCWQGIVIALLLECALGVVPSRAAQTRYACACAAMAAMVVFPMVTFGVLSPKAQVESLPYSIANPGVRYISAFGNASRLAQPWTLGCERVINQALPAVIGFWLVGALLLLCRLNLGLIAVGKMKSLSVQPAAAEMLNALKMLRARLGIEQSVRLLHSVRVQAPVVIGWLRPVILFPPGCAVGLSSIQIEAILAHELAHVRRCDYLVSLLQSAVEAVLFYHPAVWWVSSRIRREREHCCDDIAVAVSGDCLSYAKALSRMAEMRGPAAACAVAASGGALKARIARLLGTDQVSAFPLPATALLVMMAGTATAFAAHGATHAQSTALLLPFAPGQALDQTPPLSIVVDTSCLIQPESDSSILGDHEDAFRDDAICHLESVHSSQHVEEKIADGERTRFLVEIKEQEYVLLNPTDAPALFTVRHYVPQDWSINSDPRPSGTDGATALFAVHAGPGQRVHLHVGMSRTYPIGPD